MYAVRPRPESAKHFYPYEIYEIASGEVFARAATEAVAELHAECLNTFITPLSQTESE